MNNRGAIGIDVGGTKIAAGFVSLTEGRIVEKLVVPTRREKGGAFALDDAVGLAERLSAGRNVDGVGIGICELVDRAGAIVSSNCLAWTAGEVRRRFSAIAPPAIEADVRAAALAEARFGGGVGAGIFVYVSVGTGIASSLVIDGVPFLGTRGAAGTMASGRLPGLAYSLEEIASGPAIARRFSKDANEAMLAAEAGDPRAMEIIRNAAELLGASIGGLVNVLDPERVVLGGSLGLREGIYRELLRESMRRHIWWPGHRDIPVISAALGSDAGIIGAAIAARPELCVPLGS